MHVARDKQVGRSVHSWTSPDDLRFLAERFRRMADTTGMREYVQRMEKVALDLEQHAAAVESDDAVILLRLPVDRRVQELTRDFGDAVTLASAR
jgi:hypothetical protein